MRFVALALLALLAAGAAAADAVPAAVPAAVPEAEAKVLHRAQPQYPKAAAAPGVAPRAAQELQILQRVMPELSGLPAPADGGCVTVRMLIKHDGFVGEVEILEAKPEALAEPAAAALKQWWFQSFPPPDRTTVQTFYFAPDQVRLPDNAIRSPYLSLSGDGSVKSSGCGKSGTQG